MRKIYALALGFIVLFSLLLIAPDAQARRRRHHSTTASTRHHHHSTSRHRGRHHHKSTRKHRHTPKAAAKPKYAYPLDLFMLSPPEFDKSPLPEETASKVRHDFEHGIADRYHPNDLVRAGIVHYHPLHGGIFKRREPVKYIIVHSTETGPPVSAKSVIDAWSSLGRRHAGAQYVVERDGRIYQSCEPDLATVHVNIFKTLPGINNDNSIGIEMNHTGRQNYPPEQRQAVIKLVSYLQDRYHVLHENIITHRYAQQGDHTDPVAFDFDEFLIAKETFHNKAIALKKELAPTEVADIVAPAPTVYMEMHKAKQTTPIEVQTVTTPAAAGEPSVTPVSAVEDQPVSAPASIDTALTPKTAPQVAPAIPALRKEIELPPDTAVIEKPQPGSSEPEPGIP